MHRTRRFVVTMGVAGLLCAFTGLAGAAAAAPASKGVKGKPQPELRPFRISAAFSAGTVAVEPNGDLAVAYDVHSGRTGALKVCVLARGRRRCTHTAVLHTLAGDGVVGTPQVFAAHRRLVVLQGTCCDRRADDDLLYSSGNGGKSFARPVRVGSLGVDAAALVGGQIVFSQGASSNGAQAQAIAVTAKRPAARTATVTARGAYDIGDGSYRGGALVASDSLTLDYTTYVGYAKAGTNFGRSSAYRRVGKFSHQQLAGMSGAALLTLQTTGKQGVLLRLFNGHGFGRAHVVPGTRGGGPEWFAVDQDARGRVFVFSSRGLASRAYHLIEVSTRNGSRWSRPIDLGNAVRNNGFAAGLDSRGSGLVLGTDPAWGYPVLAPQTVTFTLKSSKISKGHRTTGHGTGHPARKGRTVVLQVERSGRWHTVGTAHESATGSFRFTVKGVQAGRRRYRAVASDLAGYLLYGYSPARTLRVTR